MVGAFFVDSTERCIGNLNNWIAYVSLPGEIKLQISVTDNCPSKIANKTAKEDSKNSMLSYVSRKSELIFRIS